MNKLLWYSVTNKKIVGSKRMILFAEPILEATLTLIRAVHSNGNQVIHKLYTTDNLKTMVSMKIRHMTTINDHILTTDHLNMH
jgi:hypothetical protein